MKFNQGDHVNTTDFTEDEQAAIAEALDAAAKRTADEMGLARARPYMTALKAEQKRYEALHGRFVAAIEKRA